jgi:C-terminal processing protease CtpA/Prc
MLTVCALLCIALGGAQAVPHDTVNAAERALVIGQVLDKLRGSYISEEVARSVEKEIRDREKAGRYDGLSNAAQFTQALTRDLQAATGDKHLIVRSADEPIAAGQRGCAFVNVGVLTGNIGYIKFNAFRSPEVCGGIAAAAMSLVADCDALLIDLRDNTGGDPVMVAFMSSYFFGAPVHLSDIYEREHHAAVESWTLPFVPGPRFLGKPVFILTSPRTFSGAEEFAYDLQMLKRALIVGEASGGGAHPAVPVRVGERYQVEVPVAQYVNPVSGKNWEGTGVGPDIFVREELAVQRAYQAALEDVIQRTTSSRERDEIQRQIEALSKVLNGRH